MASNSAACASGDTEKLHVMNDVFETPEHELLRDQIARFVAREVERITAGHELLERVHVGACYLADGRGSPLKCALPALWARASSATSAAGRQRHCTAHLPAR